MSLLFTICARAGSKGCKSKNLRRFKDYPISFYALSCIDLYLKEEDIEADIALSTDSEELIQLFKEQTNVSVDIIRRTPELSGDVIGKIDVIADCYKQMRERTKKDYEMVIDLDVTNPLRSVIHLKQLVLKKRETKADVVFSVTPSRRNPYFNMVMESEKGVKKVIDSKFTARQQAPAVYDINAALYAYEPSFLLSGKGIFDGYTEIIIMPDTAVLDIDSENDFVLMEILANHFFEEYPDMKIVRDHIREIMV